MLQCNFNSRTTSINLIRNRNLCCIGSLLNIFSYILSHFLSLQIKFSLPSQNRVVELYVNPEGHKQIGPSSIRTQVALRQYSRQGPSSGTDVTARTKVKNQGTKNNELSLNDIIKW